MKLETCAHCDSYIEEGEELCVRCAINDDAEAHSIDDFLDWEMFSTVSEEKLEELEVNIRWGYEG